MKLISPSYEIWQQSAGLDGLYQQIENCGRVCYKSESNKTDDSAKPFVDRMIQLQHTAMLEHGTVYLRVTSEKADKYIDNHYSKVRVYGERAFVTTNLRVLAENNWMDDLAYFVEPTSEHEKRVTVHFTTQISITREYNRHRANSMAEQSTRYCNYSKNKFGNEIAVNPPTWVAKLAEDADLDSTSLTQEHFLQLCQQVGTGATETWSGLDYWLFANLSSEFSYLQLIRQGFKPQEARAVLPLDTNTELIHTAFVSDWKHFFDLRALGTTGAPHPDATLLAKPLYDEFLRLGLSELV